MSDRQMRERGVMSRGMVAGEDRSGSGWQSVADRLQSDVIFGRIHPREHLVEDEIMMRLKVSRYAARRAFDELQRLGLAVREPNRGVYIRSYTGNEVEDLYEVRELLETQAAARIPIPVPDGLIDRLSDIEQQHERASREQRLVDFSTLNNDFHTTLYQACGNPMLSEAIGLYSLRTQPIRMHFSTDDTWRRQAIADHWAMIKALEQRDIETLANLCREHLKGPKAHYLQLYHGR